MVLLEMLEEIEFLRDIEPQYLGHLASVARLKEYPAGVVLFHEGQDSAYIYLVSRGEVALEIHAPAGRSVAIARVRPGELLGWSPVLRLGPMTATARTMTPCRVIALGVEPLLHLCEHDPRFGLDFISRTAAALAQRLHATQKKYWTSRPRPATALRGVEKRN